MSIFNDLRLQQTRRTELARALGKLMQSVPKGCPTWVEAAMLQNRLIERNRNGPGNLAQAWFDTRRDAILAQEIVFKASRSAYPAKFEDYGAVSEAANRIFRE